MALCPFTAPAQTPAPVRSIFGAMPADQRAAHESSALRLWPERAPEALGDSEADTPVLYPVLPPKGAAPVGAVLVFPGGGYNYHAAHEAFPIAEHFRQAGLAAFVLRYRLRPYDAAVALLDAQRAVRLLRAHAAEFNLDPGKIAAIGFSAGGHLAANLSTHADDGRPGATDPTDRQSCRLHTTLLIYPALVSGSFKRDDPDARSMTSLLRRDGLHRAVEAHTPPAFLVVGYDDPLTPPDHCLAYAARLHEAGVRFELHVLGAGGHGFGLRDPDPRVQIWSQLALHWLATCALLPQPTRPGQ